MAEGGTSADEAYNEMAEHMKKWQAVEERIRRQDPDLPTKGGGKRDAPRDGIRLPKEMIDNDCVGSTPAGESICYAFNMNGCDRATSGKKCPRGWHVCAVRGCFATDHAMKNHS